MNSTNSKEESPSSSKKGNEVLVEDDPKMESKKSNEEKHFSTKKEKEVMEEDDSNMNAAKNNEEKLSSSKKGKEVIAEDDPNMNASKNNEEKPPSSSKKGKGKIKKPRWTIQEEEDLVKGYNIHGDNWNVILKDKNYHFDTHRTFKSLRDKFGNMAKSQRISVVDVGGNVALNEGRTAKNKKAGPSSKKGNKCSIEDKWIKKEESKKTADAASSSNVDPFQDMAKAALILKMSQNSNDPTVSKDLEENQNEYVQTMISKLNAGDYNLSSEETDSNPDDSS